MASSKDAATHQTKLDGICKIGEFERKRLKYFTPQIKVNSTHWEAFKTTLAKSNVENERVLAFFTKRIEVEERYCQHLAELPYTDLKGTGAWRRGGRKLQPPAPAPSSSSLSSSSTTAAALKTTAGTTATATEATSTSITPPSSSSSSLPAMDAMMASTDALVLKYQDYVRDTRKELLEGKLKALVTAFKATSDEILLEGNHALDNVKVAEQHIVSAYLDYYKAYQALTLPTQPQAPAAGGAGGAAGAADMWLLDTQYRVAVELQKTIWQTTQQHLHDLFRRMKTLEVNRRSQLHALILRYMQNQGSFWAQLPQAAADCSVAISGLSSTDPNQVETELSEEIRRCAKAVEAREHHLQQQQQQQQQHAAGRGTSSAPSVGGGGGGSTTTATATMPSTPSVEPFTGHLLAPLDTPLVRRVEVLEHRLVTGVESLPLLKRWRPCLAVLTLDDFLHLFDLPSEVAPGTVLTPREAFKLLIPSPIDKKGRFKKGKEVERVSPSLTLALPFSSSRFRAEEGPEAFEIMEARQNTGFVSVFKAREVTRVVLKARTQEKMVDWVLTVNNKKEKKEEAEAEKEKKEEKEQKQTKKEQEEKETTAMTAVAAAVAEAAEAVEPPVVTATAVEEEEEEREEAASAPAVIAPLPVLGKEGGKEGGREGRDALATPPPSPLSPVHKKEGGNEEEVGGGVESETPPLPVLVEQSKPSATVPESSSSSSTA